jgi:hypothetical protein
MSTSSPFEPNLGSRDEGIPAADPGAGAPEPAPGFGIGGEQPDLVDPTQEVPAPAADGGADDDDPPFRPPDPDDVNRR